jgi:hypothetical protein
MVYPQDHLCLHEVMLKFDINHFFPEPEFCIWNSLMLSNVIKSKEASAGCSGSIVAA